MVSTRIGILRLLADGRVHSGADIGTRLGITRAAVSKGVKALVANGLVVNAVPGIGYQLRVPTTPLDRRSILRHIDSARVPVRRIDILEKVDSTSRYLLAQALADADPTGMVCLAEAQPQGRGRQGKVWIATSYENLMMSMAWRFTVGPAMVSGLSLAAGVAVVRALEDYGVRNIGLKWPNDVLWRTRSSDIAMHSEGRQSERKLAGLLVDVHGEASGPCTVVLGVGLNCSIESNDAKLIPQPWVDLRTILGETPDRNRLAGLLINHLYDMFSAFAVSGFAAFQADWIRYHFYADRSVRMLWDSELFDGVVEGVDENGALRLRGTRGEMRTFHSGEVSLRPK